MQLNHAHHASLTDISTQKKRRRKKKKISVNGYCDKNYNN